ncbi:TIGR02285 family protein [Herbaspirillum rubrisubalbicans]|uniref:ABC transporter substrate-binding protein n=1 Tax=Herbaspirillum rubrisubalbicans TaxID=80842 RepID=A0ABX9C4Q8_9BURK|nr:TIGR02285 family protein [Herbaspirillum rubrisubalbicans]RAM65452.1 ABC transporter substrate-binding protein [Herbaspirillum rubrisubalbicans]
MHSKLVRIPITALMLSCLAPLALATEQIVWGKYNVPPYMIRSGEFAHQGIFDLTLDIIKKKLPQYQHVELEAPFPRINSEIVKGSHWCYNGMLKTPERENFGYLSLPISIFLPLRIIVRRDRLAQFKSPLSLQALLQNRQLTTSVMRDRSYSPTVDMLLADYRPQENYSEQVEAIGMLLAGRIDYMIELPLLAFEQARAMGQPDALVALPMQEANEVVFNRVMCPKNEWGRQVVEQVNKVLLEERAKPFYRAIVEKWHDPESVAQIRNIYDKVFLNIP